MKPRQPWAKHTLRRIWLYQTILGVVAALSGVSVAQIFLGFPNSLFAIFHSRQFFPLYLHLFIIATEVVLYNYVRLPPLLAIVLETCKLALPTKYLYSSLIHHRLGFFSSGYHPDWPFIRRIVTISAQKPVIYLALWLAVYNGLVYTLFVWAAAPRISSTEDEHSAESSSEHTISQFDFAEISWSHALHLVEWTSEGSKRSEPGIRGMGKWTIQHLLAYLKWIPRNIAIMTILGPESRFPGEQRLRLWRGGVRYRDDESALNPDDWDYPRSNTESLTVPRWTGVTRSQEPVPAERDSIADISSDGHSIYSLHDRSATSTSLESTQSAPLQPYPEDGRQLHPRYLCIIDKTEKSGYKIASTGSDPQLFTMPYVFISYTRRQFHTEIPADPSLSDEERREKRDLTDKDSKALISLAICATNEADVPAFWIDFKCLQPEVPADAQASKSIDDVYQICDIVRTSHSMAIMIGPPVSERTNGEDDDAATAHRKYLFEWGDRVWTMPEALLCPSNYGIAIYSALQPGAKVAKVEKRNLALHVWRDAAFVGQLIEHYEGSVRLSQIQLITVALQSLQRRQTVPRMDGDVIYALMGLMRERLRVKPNDTAFQAFARLSLANDSQSPLERLFCARPYPSKAAWHNISDFWQAKLWDISPTCQVSEVCDDDSVILGNLMGAEISWEPLPATNFFMTPPSAFTGRLARLHRALAMSTHTLILACWYMGTFHLIMKDLSGGFASTLVNIQFSLMFYPLCVLLILLGLSPPFFSYLYRGSVNKAQARFYGFRGVADLQAVDRALFGLSANRISWSPLNPNETTSDTQGEHDGSHESKIFTLVDTWLLTASTFIAEEPPSVVMAAGTQGGLLRTLLCSYDVSTETFCRETVLQMETKVLQRMSRMDQCKVSLGPRPRFTDDSW